MRVRKFRAGWMTGLIATLGVASTALAGDRVFVSSSAPLGGNGRTWATAFRTLMEGLATANNSQGAITEVWVSAGIYRPDCNAIFPDGTGDRTDSFYVTGGVVVRGGFAGTEDPATFDLATRDFAVNKTILSGDLARNDGANFANYGDNSYHVVYIEVGAAPVLDGLVVSSGNANHYPGDVNGGGVYNTTGNPVLTNCTLVGNAADSYGAGLYSGGGSPILTRCAILGNRSGSEGGGLYNSKGHPRLDDCTFNGNRTSWFGGAFCTRDGDPHLTNCVFTGNQASGGVGAGISILRGSPLLTNCMFCGNAGGSSGGSGVYNDGGSPVLTNCTISGNSGGTYGGTGMKNAAGNPVLTNCIIWANSFACISGTATITYSCIQGGWPGAGNIDTDPRVQLDGHVRIGSPCIDAGTNLVVPAGVGVDPDGHPRMVNDPDTLDTGLPDVPGGAIVDMGAYEYQPGPAERLYVNAGAAPGGDGQTWARAYNYLQDAFAAAHARPRVTEIWVAAGTYKPDRDAAHPTGTGDQAATFVLPNAVAVYGGFPGLPGQEGDFSVRDTVACPTIMSGDLAGNDGASVTTRNENSTNVMKAVDLGPTTVLDGCTITGGNSPISSDAGGLLIYSGRLNVSHCSFSANTPGGIYAISASPVITACAFLGSMQNQSSNTRLTDCVFTKGSFLSSGNPTLLNCLFTGGGSVTTGGGSPVLLNCAIIGAVGYCGFGGYGTPSLINCTITGGARDGVNASGTSSLTNCIVWGNGGSEITGSATVSYSCVEGGWPGEGNINADPRIMFDANGCPRLRHGSPCIDSGNGAAILAGISTDLGGDPRFVDDPATADTGLPASPAGAVVDMGAYEYRPFAARRVYVKAEAAPGGDGTSWTAAYTYLQDALLAAQADAGITEIWVAQGVYKPDRDAQHPAGTGNRTASFQLQGGVNTYGGFPGQPGQEGDFSVRDPAGHVTLLSGDLAGNDAQNFANNTENSYHVVSASGLGLTTVFDGFTVSGGNANSNVDPNLSGGGVYVPVGALTLQNCILTGNSANVFGGGIHNGYGSDCRLTNCKIVKNLNEGFNADGNCTLVNCVLADNQGSGIVSWYSQSAMINCTVCGNADSGVEQPFASITLTNCVVWGNKGDSQIDGQALVTHSCIQGGWPGAGNIDADPKLLSSTGGNLHLRHGSPCIDAGDNTALPANAELDVEGNQRYVDDPDTPDTGNAGGTSRGLVDMGAYEYWPAPARCLHVRSDAPSGGDGASWSTAYAHLQDALAVARADAAVTQIWVARGTYRPDRDAAHAGGSRDQRATFQLANGVSIYGGFPGASGQEGQFTARNPGTYRTALSGDLAGNDGANFTNMWENSFHVVTSGEADSATLLDGFTISGGFAMSDGNGGGVYLPYRSSPTLVNCRFSGNKATQGGGLYNERGRPNLINCVFYGNTASLGGGLFNRYGQLALTNCTIAGNSADFGAGACNYDYYATLTLSNCILWGNTGYAPLGGTASITHSCVQGTQASQGNIAADPLFVSMAGGSLQLSSGSPCIDAGSNTAVPPWVSTDSVGHFRFMDDTTTADCRYAPGTCGLAPIVDMGAYEFNGIAADFDQDGDVDRDDRAVLQACVSGPAVALRAGCQSRDLDYDGDVDQADFGIFQRCYSGPNVPADPS